jgi:predicted PurR-regulated permease PerM
MLRDPWLRALAVLACAIAGIYLVGLLWSVVQEFADIILLFFMAWLLAFVLEPLVLALIEVVRLPRLAAIGLTYVILLVLLSFGVILLVPALTLQVVEIARNLPTYSERVVNAVTDLQSTANNWLLDHASPVVFDVKSALNAQELGRRVDALGPPILSNALGFATGAATLLVNLLIMLILSFYFMADGARLAEALIRTLPPRAQDDTRFLVASIHRAFAGFLRGQVIQALAGAIGTGFMMSFLQVDFALLSSVVAGLVLFIPFLGPIIAVILPVTIAMFTHPEVVPFLFIALLALQQVIFNVLAPRVLSRQVGLHPLLVFFAVLTGARVAGVWGAIFGVPIVAVLITMVSFYRANQEERVARLQEHLPGQELVSVEMPPDEELVPAATHQ